MRRLILENQYGEDFDKIIDKTDLRLLFNCYHAKILRNIIRFMSWRYLNNDSDINVRLRNNPNEMHTLFSEKNHGSQKFEIRTKRFG